MARMTEDPPKQPEDKPAKNGALPPFEQPPEERTDFTKHLEPLTGGDKPKGSPLDDHLNQPAK
jgi:hypothetical protein